MTATQCKTFQLGKWYRVKKPLWKTAPPPSCLKWTTEMDKHDGKIFQCKRTFFGGIHAFLRSSCGLMADVSCGMHIDWVEGPYDSEIIAKREEVADGLRATVMANGDGWIEKNTLKKDNSWSLSEDVEKLFKPEKKTAQISDYVKHTLPLIRSNPYNEITLPDNSITVMGKAWRQETQKLVQEPRSTKTYINGRPVGRDQDGATEFRNEITGEVTKLETTKKENKESKMITTDSNSGSPNWAVTSTPGNSITVDDTAGTLNVGGIATTVGTTLTISGPEPHSDADRARDESCVVNGLLYPNGYPYGLTVNDSVCFPSDHPEALGLSKIKNELESLIKEGHRILDEVEEANDKRKSAVKVVVKGLQQSPDKDLQQSLADIDKKYNDEIDRAWKDFHKRQSRRAAVDERTMSELEQTFPRKKSYRWVRWAVGLLSLAGIAGSAVYFLM